MCTPSLTAVPLFAVPCQPRDAPIVVRFLRSLKPTLVLTRCNLRVSYSKLTSSTYLYRLLQQNVTRHPEQRNGIKNYPSQCSFAEKLIVNQPYQHLYLGWRTLLVCLSLILVIIVAPIIPVLLPVAGINPYRWIGNT
jgi:hypothetical protein